MQFANSGTGHITTCAGQRRPAWRAFGVQPHVIERVLNHASGTFAGVAGVYNRFDYLDEMRAAIELSEQHVFKLVELTVAGA